MHRRVLYARIALQLKCTRLHDSKGSVGELQQQKMPLAIRIFQFHLHMKFEELAEHGHFSHCSVN